MKVRILCSIPDSKYFDNCTLVFRTLRVGFPTAHVHVTVNNIGEFKDFNQAVLRAQMSGANWVEASHREWHHADWIKHSLETHSSDEPLILLDSDIHFWKSCEDWEFEHYMAGYYVPEIWNDWAKCRSVERLHTSFLWFPNVLKLLQAVDHAYPWAKQARGEYCPCDPYCPDVKFIRGEPVFWDTCATLFNMLGGNRFTDEHMACYEHLNSSGFVEEMAKRMGGPTGTDFRRYHELVPGDMNLARTFGWPMTKNYYAKKAAQVVPRYSVDRPPKAG